MMFLLKQGNIDCIRVGGKSQQVQGCCSCMESVCLAIAPLHGHQLICKDSTPLDCCLGHTQSTAKAVSDVTMAKIISSHGQSMSDKYSKSSSARYSSGEWGDLQFHIIFCLEIYSLHTWELCGENLWLFRTRSTFFSFRSMKAASSKPTTLIFYIPQTINIRVRK